MAPRRGGEGGAGAVAAFGGGRCCLDPPPLKRIHPWQNNGAAQCEIIAGAVDHTGILKGIHLSGVHLLALLRTLQLSKTLMPVDTTTPLASLGQSLQDGIPLIVLTRGCFGRDLDFGPGPVRNDAQKAVWETVRQMRAEMPQVLITCIDVPINVSSDVVQQCMSEPLNEYRELMYHDGTWFARTIINSASLARWKSENRREKLQKHNVVGVGGFNNRKKFGWMDEASFFKDMWSLGWKPVLKRTDPPIAPDRTDLVFVTDAANDVKPITDFAPSAAEVTFRRLLSKSRQSRDPREMLSHIKAYLDRAKGSEKSGLEEAQRACLEAAQLLEERGDLQDASQAKGMAVGACIWRNEVGEGLQIAKSMQVPGVPPGTAVKAAKLALDCYFALGELDQALEAAVKVKDDVQKQRDEAALCEAWGLVVTAHMARGDFEAAIAAATSATGSSDKRCKAQAWRLVAESQMASASHSESDANRKPKYDAAVLGHKSARALYDELGCRKEAADTVAATSRVHLVGGFSSAAFEAAEELDRLTKDADDRELQILAATASQLMAMSHLQQYNTDASFLRGGGEAMVASARGAVAAFEELGDSARRAVAQRVLLQALRAHPSNN